MIVNGTFPKGAIVAKMEVESKLGTFVLRDRNGVILATGQLSSCR